MKLHSDGFEGLFLDSYPRMPWGTRVYNFLCCFLISNFIILVLLHATLPIWSSPVPDAIHSYRLPPNQTHDLHYGRSLVGLYMNWGGRATGVLWVGFLIHGMIQVSRSGKPVAKGKLDGLGD